MPASSTVKSFALTWVGRAAPIGATSVIGQVSSVPSIHSRGSAASAAVPFWASKSHSTQAQPSTTPALSEICTYSGVPGGSGTCQILTYLPLEVATSYQSRPLMAVVAGAPGGG